MERQVIISLFWRIIAKLFRYKQRSERKSVRFFKKNLFLYGVPFVMKYKKGMIKTQDRCRAARKRGTLDRTSDGGALIGMGREQDKD